jgi:hypothetical protein
VRTSYLYALEDPRNPGVVRYIGVTRNSLRVRLNQHRATHNNPRTPVAFWIRKLLSEGVEPTIVEMASGDESWDVYTAEVEAIALFASSGLLLNVTPGGRGGGIGPKSPEHAAKISAALKGRKVTRSDEWRAAHAEKMRGKTRTPEQRAKIGEASRRAWADGRHKTYERTEEHRARMAAAQLARYAAKAAMA